MNIVNQKPVTLVPHYIASPDTIFDLDDIINQVLIDPLFEPLIASAPVTMSANGTDITQSDILDCVCAIFNDTIDVQKEKILKEIYGNSLIYYNKNTNLTINEIFGVQSSVELKLPEPSSLCIYSPKSDIIPSCKKFIAKTGSSKEVFTSIMFYARPRTLGIMFINEIAFDEFKKWANNEIANSPYQLPIETTQAFNDFMNIKLNNLTESFLIRNEFDENNDPLSFARVLTSLLMQYKNIAQDDIYDIMPFNTAELLCPKSITFVNVERHAKANTKQITDEWTMINNAIKNKLSIVSNNKLSSLTAIYRNASKIKNNATMAKMNSNGDPVQKAQMVAFSKTPLTSVDIVKKIKRVMEKMTTASKSENIYKKSKMSFARPNRRNPDDFNKQGKIVSTKYRPDIHLYIDTSGSISERNYQDAVKACIHMAKKLNINLYFNSFSHCISQCTKLNVKDKSAKQIYKEFQRVQKVTGGTEYEQVWEYISKSKKRQKELSIMMTDFEYRAPNYHVNHPKNLYYLPISNSDWNWIKDEAEMFCMSMTHIESNIRKHVLF